MTLIESNIAYDELSDAELVSVCRVFGCEQVARLFDQPGPDVNARAKLAGRRMAEKATNGSGESDSIDLFYLKNQIGRMLKPYLDDEKKWATAKDRKEMLNLAIQFYDLSGKTAKVVNEFVENRDMLRMIMTCIKGLPNSTEFLTKIMQDTHIRELLS